MSEEQVRTIIGRAVIDADYREIFFNDPDTALAGYELTAEEAQSLKDIKREAFDEVAAELEERISRAGFSPMSLDPQVYPKVELPVGITDTRLLGRLFNR